MAICSRFNSSPILEIPLRTCPNIFQYWSRVMYMFYSLQVCYVGIKYWRGVGIWPGVGMKYFPGVIPTTCQYLSCPLLTATIKMNRSNSVTPRVYYYNWIINTALNNNRLVIKRLKKGRLRNKLTFIEGRAIHLLRNNIYIRHRERRVYLIRRYYLRDSL